MFCIHVTWGSRGVGAKILETEMQLLEDTSDWEELLVSEYELKHAR